MGRRLNPIIRQALRVLRRGYYCDDDDMMQAAAIALWRRGNPESPAEAYVVARSAMIDEIRRWYGRGARLEFIPWRPSSDRREDGDSPEACLRVAQALEIIEHGLSPVEYTTVERCACGMSQVDIAREDHVSESAVSCRLRGVRRKLAAAV